MTDDSLVGVERTGGVSAGARSRDTGGAHPRGAAARLLTLAAAFAASLLCAAGLARADVLVGNAAQGYSGRVSGGLALDLAQGFTTGNDSAGYTLSAIALRFANASPAAAPAVTVHTGTPIGTTVATLSGPSEVGAGMATFRAPASTTLTGATAYFVRVEGGGRVELALTRGREDAGAASGWRIHDTRHYRFAHSTGSFESVGSSHVITVSGTARSGTATATAPAAKPTASDGGIVAFEDSSYAFAAGDFGFSGATSGDSLSSVEVVTLPGEGSLMLRGRPVAGGDAVIRVDIDAGRFVFTPAANASGDDYATFTFKVAGDGGESASDYTMTIDVTAVADPATGAPSIHGTAKVGHKLTTSTGSIRDADGLPSAFTYQWIRVDGSSETDIASATSLSYTLVTADRGKRIRVKVNFTDGGGNSESLTSEATDTVEAAVTEVCNPPEFRARRPIWNGTVTVGSSGASYGYMKDSYGALDDAGFDIGTASYSIASVVVSGQGASRTLAFATQREVSEAHGKALTLHVCDDASLSLNQGGKTWTWPATRLDWSSASTRMLRLSLPANNNAPTAANGAVTVDEDTPHTFGAADFRFAGADPKDSLASITIETLTAAGTLALDGAAVAAGAEVARADLDTGSLVFTPAANAHGDDYASFTFRVSGGGSVASEAAYTMTVDVTPVNDSAKGRPWMEAKGGWRVGQRVRPKTSGITDADGLPSEFFHDWIIVSADGTETESDAFGPWYVLRKEDVGKRIRLKVSFTDGGRTQESLTSDASTTVAGKTGPIASDRTVTAREDTDYRFQAGDFGFSAANVGDTFASLEIVTLSSAGELWLELSPSLRTHLLRNRSVSRADIDAGRLVFRPDPDANGRGYARFTFKVSDGTEQSRFDYTMTIDVAPVDDPPEASNRTVTTEEDTAYTFRVSNFGYVDPDAGDLLEYVSIVTPPSSGTLALDGDDVTQWQQIARANIDAGELVFTPVANANGDSYARFTFKVSDGSALSIHADHYTMTIDVTPVNDPATGKPSISGREMVDHRLVANISGLADIDGLPHAFAWRWIRVDGATETPIPGAIARIYRLVEADLDKTLKVEVRFTDGDGFAESSTSDATGTVVVNPKPKAADTTVTVNEDTGHALQAGDFNFTSAVGNTLASVKVAAVPTRGTLALDGTPVTANQSVTKADIDANRLVFTPEANANGDDYASFLFRVSDGTAESAAYLMTINVTPVNDPATGAPAVTGKVQVEHTVVADIGAIVDADGLPARFDYQWIRVDGTTETDIAGAGSQAYTLTSDDEGTKVKVKVSFTDEGGAAESVTSGVTVAVGTATGATCNAPSFTNRRAIWTGTVTVGDYFGVAQGYSSQLAFGALDNTRFRVGTSDFRISDVYVYRGNVQIFLHSELDLSLAFELVLHVCDKPFRFDEFHQPSKSYKWSGSLDWSSVSERTLYLSVPAGAFPPKGVPSILGDAELGRTLFAWTGDIADGDEPPGGFAYQWIRVDGATEADIEGATTNQYNLASDDEGKRIRVRVSFSDSAGTLETVTSLATGVVQASTTSGCGAPSFGERRLMWTGRMLVEYDENRSYVGRGYANFSGANPISLGELWSDRFSVGATDYRIRAVLIDDRPNLEFWLDPNLSSTHRAALVLHVCGDNFTLAGSSFHGSDYNWNNPGLDWSSVNMRRLYLSLPANNAATGAAAITGPAQLGETLTASTSDIADADGLPDSFDYQWVRVDADETQADIEGATGGSYDLVADDVGKTVKVRVTFTDALDGEESLTSDAWPSSGTVVRPTVCNAPDLAAEGRRSVWTGTLTVGRRVVNLLDLDSRVRADETVGYGFKTDDTGALAPDRFTLDSNGYAIGEAFVFTSDHPVVPLGLGYGAGHLLLSLEEGLSAAEREALTLHVCARAFALNDAVYEVHGAKMHDYTWSASELDWSGTPERTLYLSVPQTPGALSVADAAVDEGPGATLDFVVTLSGPSGEAVTVDYATSDETATAGSDYTATSGTLTFASGETGKTVSVAVLDDAHDDGGETVTFTLSNPSGATIDDGEATGTIDNTDAMPKAWLARFGRTVASQVLDAVESRLEASRQPGVEASVAGQRLGGGATLEEAARREAEARLEALSNWLRNDERDTDGSGFETRGVSARELLTGSSFALTGGSAETGFGALWGRGAVSRFDGREGELTLDGEVTSAMLGADFTRGRATAGLMLSHSRGEGGYRSPAGGGAVESSVTGLYPWGSYAVSERLSVWGVAGYGEGTLALTPEGAGRIETDMALAMGALGLRGVLIEAPEEGGVELSVKTDAMGVRTTSEAARGEDGGNMAGADAKVTRLRLGLQATWHGVAAGSGTLTPSVEVGVRHDGGDAETGYGADIGAGLSWSDPERGISAEVRGRGLLTHEADGFGERGFSGTLSFDPEPDSERGLSFALTQTVGASASGGADALLGRGHLEGLAANDDGEGLGQRRLEARLGYGFALFGGRFTGTPEIGLGLSDAHRDYSLGWRLAEARPAGLAFGLDVEGGRRERASGDGRPEHRLGLGLAWRLEGAGAGRFELRFEGARLDGAANDNAEHRLGARLIVGW